VISDQISVNINRLKQQVGKNILIFGSPGASHSLLNEGLVDEFWLFVNPVILGKGMHLFKDVQTTSLRLVESKTFACGVIALHYEKLIE
jgi:dihydrofolate reductase